MPASKKKWNNAPMNWLVEYARGEGCDQFHLDSGVQRFAAHRFYLNRRMAIEATAAGIEADTVMPANSPR